VPTVRPERIDTSRARARGIIAGFLVARPGLTHHMPADAQGRGAAWPSPRTWEMALRLLTFADACSVDREALGTALTGAIGDGPGVELLTFAEELDLPDPERVLANPDAFALPDRGDRQLAFLTAVVAAVQARVSRERWTAAWAVIAKAVDAGVPDVAARAAMDLARMRQQDWKPPEHVDALIDLIALSGELK
jgi:hypothetical protein